MPWYNNTLLVSVHILYQLGVRRIILAGSDFSVGGEHSDYASGQRLVPLEKRWNTRLYNNIVRELRLLKPLFDQYNLELLDSSANSRLTPVYRNISLKDASQICLNGFPKTPVDADQLPHCSKFASKDIKDIIAGWPAHQHVAGVNNDARITTNTSDSVPSKNSNLHTVI